MPSKISPKSHIDVLLPYWGEFSLLKKTVESVLSQTETNWQLLVFDDAYPSDEAEKYFKTLGDSRVSYYRHKINIGITNNFNFAVNAAKAEYCMILGCDDKLLPNYIETALKNIGDADFYQPGVEVIDEHDRVYNPVVDKIKAMLRPKKSGTYSGEKLATSLCHGNWLYFPSIVWKTSTLNHYAFDTKYKIVEDLVVELDMIIDGAVLYFDTTTTFCYRRFADSLSSKEKKRGGVRFHEEDMAYDLFFNKFRSIGWRKASRAAKFRITSRLNRLVTKP